VGDQGGKLSAPSFLWLSLACLGLVGKACVSEKLGQPAPGPVLSCPVLGAGVSPGEVSTSQQDTDGRSLGLRFQPIWAVRLCHCDRCKAQRASGTWGS
jgi:hypothetical protein